MKRDERKDGRKEERTEGREGCEGRKERTEGRKERKKGKDEKERTNNNDDSGVGEVHVFFFHMRHWN